MNRRAYVFVEGVRERTNEPIIQVYDLHWSTVDVSFAMESGRALEFDIHARGPGRMVELTLEQFETMFGEKIRREPPKQMPGQLALEA